MSKKWFYFKNRKAVGPFEWEKIVELYEKNKLIKKSNIWCDEYADWVTLGQVLEQKKENSLALRPLPFQEQQPPPLPKNTKKPPPLPQKSFSILESEKRNINVGPIQSKEDYIASQRITKISFAILSIVGSLTLIGLLGTGFKDDTKPTKKASQKWPSSFGFDTSSSYDPEWPTLSQSLVEDLYYAEGFKIGQDKSISSLSNKYSKLSGKFLIAQLKFESEFGAAYDNIDKILSSELSNWNQDKETIRSTVSEKLNYKTISKNDAESFLQEVESRVQGEIPSPVLETLLMFHPKYIRDPHRMFGDGYIKEYRSINSVNAKGIDMAIQYPSSWKAEKGRRPNVIQKIRSENGYGFEFVTIVIKDFPEDAKKLSEEDILLLSGKNFWDNVHENAHTVDEGSVILASKPTIWGEFSGSINRTGIELDMYGLAFAMIHKEAMIQIMFMNTQKKGENNINVVSKFQHLAPTFQMMLNSLDFFDKYD